MKSWEKEKINKDKLFKEKVLNSLKKKPDYKKIRKEAEKNFSLRKIISRTFLGGVELGHFVVGNNAWGYNIHTMNMNYYKIVLKEYKVYTGDKGDKGDKFDPTPQRSHLLTSFSKVGFSQRSLQRRN